MNYYKIRYMRSRVYGKPSTYECKIIGRVSCGVWDTLGTTRGHATVEAARNAGLKLAARRGIKLENAEDTTGKTVRQIEFKDTYGED